MFLLSLFKFSNSSKTFINDASGTDRHYEPPLATLGKNLFRREEALALVSFLTSLRHSNTIPDLAEIYRYIEVYHGFTCNRFINVCRQYTNIHPFYMIKPSKHSLFYHGRNIIVHTALGVKIVKNDPCKLSL